MGDLGQDKEFRFYSNLTETFGGNTASGSPWRQTGWRDGRGCVGWEAMTVVQGEEVFGQHYEQRQPAKERKCDHR